MDDVKLSMAGFKSSHGCYFVIQINDGGYYRRQVNKLLARLSVYINQIVQTHAPQAYAKRPSGLPASARWPVDLLDKDQAMGFLTAKKRVKMYGSTIANSLVSPPAKKGTSTYASRRFFGRRGAMQDIYYSWTQAGFGWPCHVRGLKMNYVALPQLKRIIETATGLTLGLGDVPHQIFKFYGGGKLAAHTDGLSLKGYLNVCMHVRSCSEYMRNVGIQILFHTVGGNARTGGGTIFLHPMSVHRYAIILLLMRSGACGVKKMSKFSSPDKQGYSYFKNRAAFNRVILRVEAAGSLNSFLSAPSSVNDPIVKFVRSLKPTEQKRIFTFDKGTNSVRGIPLQAQNPGAATNGPYVIVWPRGFPHAANANKKGFMRFTSVLPFTANLAEKTPYVTPDKIIHRVKLLGRMKSADANVRALAMGELSTHPGYTFNAGPCHKNPQVESKFYPYFSDMMIDEEDATRFVNLFSRKPQKLSAAQRKRKTALELRLRLLQAHLAKLKKRPASYEKKSLSRCSHPSHTTGGNSTVCPRCGTPVAKRRKARRRRRRRRRKRRAVKRKRRRRRRGRRR